MHSPSSQPKLRANDDGEIRVGSPIPVSLNRRLKANAVQVDGHKRSLPKSKAFGAEKEAKKLKDIAAVDADLGASVMAQKRNSC